MVLFSDIFMHVHPFFPFYVIFAVFVIFIYDRPHVSVISLSVYYYFNVIIVSFHFVNWIP